MRKLKLSLVTVFLLSGFFLSAQIIDCEPDPNCNEMVPGEGAICPENLPPAQYGESYDETITIIPFAEAEYMGFPVEVVKLVLENVEGLPEGITWGKNEEEFPVTDPPTRYCISFYGTPEEVGEFPLVLYISPTILFMGSPVNPGTQVVDTILEPFIVLPATGSLIADFMADPTTVNYGEFVQFTDMSEGFPNHWEWTFPGGMPENSTEQNPTVQYDIPGECYDVTLTVYDGVNVETHTKEDFICVVDPVGMTQQISEKVKVYPNPANSQITVEAKNIVNISIMDINGRLIKVSNDNSELQVIDLNDISAGNYFIRIKTKENTFVKNITVK